MRSPSLQPEEGRQSFMIGSSFCNGSKAASAARARWASRIEAARVELTEADLYVVDLLASREARLEDLRRELRRERDADRWLRVVQAERLAAADMAKALDQADRVLGIVIGQEDEEPARRDNDRQRGIVAQRIASAVARESQPLTRAELRRRVAGSENDFGEGLREALLSAAVVRNGAGKRGRPYTYSKPGAK